MPVAADMPCRAEEWSEQMRAYYVLARESLIVGAWPSEQQGVWVCDKHVGEGVEGGRRLRPQWGQTRSDHSARNPDQSQYLELWVSLSTTSTTWYIVTQYSL